MPSLAASRLVCLTILFDRHLETPGHRFCRPWCAKSLSKPVSPSLMFVVGRLFAFDERASTAKILCPSIIHGEGSNSSEHRRQGRSEDVQRGSEGWRLFLTLWILFPHITGEPRIQAHSPFSLNCRKIVGIISPCYSLPQTVPKASPTTCCFVHHHESEASHDERASRPESAERDQHAYADEGASSRLPTCFRCVCLRCAMWNRGKAVPPSDAIR
jgi:hypothetical protein